MLNLRSALVLFAALGAGVVLAVVSLWGPGDGGPRVWGPGVWGPGERPPEIQTRTSATPPESPTSDTSTLDIEALAPRPVRTIPFKKPVDSSSETIGGSVNESAPRTMQPSVRDSQAAASPGAVNDARPCNRDACSRKYRSFDSLTCTYRPYGGGPRQRCEK
jgi:hypothetical protein